MRLSRLDGWPARSPADASPLASRPDTHGSGPTWIATPSSYRTLTDYSWPVSRRTTKSLGGPGCEDLSIGPLHSGQPCRRKRHWHRSFLPGHCGFKCAVLQIDGDPLPELDPFEIAGVGTIRRLGP